jgi:hypothetical protein
LENLSAEEQAIYGKLAEQYGIDTKSENWLEQLKTKIKETFIS